MNKKWLVGCAISLLLLIVGATSTMAGGGWIVFTVESWPETVVVDQPFTVRFAMRVAGQHLLTAEQVFDDRHGKPNIRAIHKESGERIDFEIEAADKTGFYEATLELPQTGSWSWTIHAGDRAYMPPLTVVSADTAVSTQPATTQQNSLIQPTTETYKIISITGLAIILLAGFLGFKQKMRFAPFLGLGGVLICLIGILLLPSHAVETAVAQPEATTSTASTEMGEILFQAKGCVSCHHHDKVNYQGTRTNIGPDLTERDVSAEFLRIWLRNPADVRPETYMPNLELSDAEIESLITFLLPSKTTN